MRSRRKLIIALYLISTVTLFGQTGTEFWFAAPDVSAEHYNNSIPLMLHITAVYNTHVTISRPADADFTPVEFDLLAQQTQPIRLDALLDITEIEVYNRDVSDLDFLQNKGFLIEASPGEITAYYELEGRNNTDIVALKSTNGMGRDFWVSTQRKYKNHGYSDDFSGFVIVATEDGTVVNVDPNGNNLYLQGSTPFSITLNKGQAFSMRAAGQSPAQHIHGIHVTSSKDITIIVFDDSMQIDDGSGNWDIFADQLVPVELIGTEYIVMKGHVQDNAANTKDGEAIFITSTVANTIVYIDDVAVDTMGPPGDYFSYDIKNLSTHIRTTEPVYVNHITGYSTDPAGARELGGAILPSVDKCTGSNSVTVKRTPAPDFVFFNNLMVRNDTAQGSENRNKAIYNFTFSIDGGTPMQINPAHFTYIMDSAFAIFDRTKAGGAAYYNLVSDNQILRVENSIARFHLGVMQGKQSPGCKYGYFSDYAANDAAVGIGGTVFDYAEYCNLNPIMLAAAGGRAYRWYGTVDPTLVDKLDYDTVPTPYFFPEEEGFYQFYCKIAGECNASDSLPVEIIVSIETPALFSFSDDELCSPHDPILTNLTNDTLGVHEIWTIKPATGSAYEFSQDTIPRTFELNLPENHTDTAQVHTVELTVKGNFYTCPTKRRKQFTVLPQIDAAFSKDASQGCHPFTLGLINNSSGHWNENSFTWDFGDNAQSFTPDSLQHTYSNYGLIDSTYRIKLLAESPLGCQDSITDSITVHPRVKAAMAMNTGSECSPIEINIDPSNSMGVDTFFWHIDYPGGDSIYLSTLKTTLNLFHRDTTWASPDTIRVDMIAMNRMGCADTVTPRRVIVYPEVRADFTVDKTEICDAESVTFTNVSQGINLFYEWDFLDGAFYQDTLGNDTTHIFFNRSPNDSIYPVNLQVTSEYLCRDTFELPILVHPYVKANFGLDYSNNCTPLLANFSNLSIAADSYTWDFGNDSTSTTNLANFIIPYWNDNELTDTTYFIKLIARNVEGCSDSLTRSLDVFPHVNADFTLTPDPSFCSPRSVSFTNESTGGLLSYLWDLGNGTTSTFVNPLDRSYTNFTSEDTTYYISLTAFNPYGCGDSIIDSVDVFALVDADFNIPRVDSCSPFDLRPENLSSAGAHFYNWDLLNTDMSIFEGTLNDFTPTFSTLTNLTDETDSLYLRLMAYGANDADHLACADRDSVMILVYPELDVSFSLADPLEQCQPFRSPLVNNTNLLAANGTNFQWFIDSTFYSVQEVPPALNIPNLENIDQDHTILLTGESMFGCTGQHSQDITVYSLVDAKFTLNKSGICSADTFEIDRRTSRGGIEQFEWQFGVEPLSYLSDEVFTKSFENLTNSLVNIPIRLVVSNSHACTDTAKKSINVYPAVVAGFDIDTAQVCYPFITEFDNFTQNANNFAWDFGDGTGSNRENPLPHIFENFDKISDKSYTIRLTARSQYNCYDSTKHDLLVYAKPEAEFSFIDAVDCPPFNAQMINESDGLNLTYFWDLNGNGTSTDTDVTQLFSNSGTMIDSVPILLVATSERGCVDSVTHTLHIYPDVVVDFTSSDYTGCSPLNVTLDGSATNNTSLLWEVDDQAFSTILSTTYRFVNNTPGTREFDVRLSAQSVYGCHDDTTKTIRVYPTPTAEFIPDPLLQEYNTQEDRTMVRFNNETFFQDTWNYAWTYGDGNGDENSASSFEYYYGDHFWGPIDNDSRVPVTLIAWNEDNEACRDTVSYDIFIRPPLPEIALDDDIEGCQPLTVDFASTTKYIYEDQYQWEFGFDDEGSTEAEPTFTYEEPGIYTVKLIVEGDGGTNWDFRRITVHPKPIVDFTFNDSSVFIKSMNHPDEVINFYNHTELGQNYAWYFNLTSDNIDDFEEIISDSGAVQSRLKDPTWFYDETGTFYVGLLASSAEGCSDYMISSMPIEVLGEGALRFPTAFMAHPDFEYPEDYSDDPKNPSPYIFRGHGDGIAEYKLEVYNRWGVLIFESHDINHGWNGYINGKIAKQDVYVWRAKGRYTNGEAFVFSGDITLFVGKVD